MNTKHLSGAINLFKKENKMKIEAQDIIDDNSSGEEEFGKELEESQEGTLDEEEQYTQKVEAIEAKYKPNMERILEEMRQSFTQAGYSTSEVFDMSDEHLSLSFVVYKEGERDVPFDFQTEEGPQEHDVEVRFDVAPSIHFDGTMEGVNFMVDVTSVGGEIIGGLTPFNYTGDVWVDVNDEAAVEERFNIFNQSDPGELLYLVEDFWGKK